MNVYTPEGWVDVPGIMGMGYPFVFLIGGRGIGKTYGALDNTIYKNGEKIIYMRRTDVELSLCMTEELNPFRQINADTGRNITIKKKGDLYRIEEGENYHGMGLSLSSVANVRSMSAEDINIMIFDEFIRDRNKRQTIKDEADAFFNMYESINRNRELFGRPPVTCLCASNSQDIANPIFIKLGFVKYCDRAQRKGVYPYVYKNNDMGALLIDFGPSSPISEKKKETALYKLTKNTDFYKMSIENQYVYNPASTIKSAPLKEYRPVVFVGDIGIYKHKSNGTWYVSTHKMGAAPSYAVNATELRRFQKNWTPIYYLYLSDKLVFESYTAEALLTEYFKS